MKKKKRIIAVILAVFMSASVLTACGGKNESSYTFTEEHTTAPTEVKIPLSDKECKGYYGDIREEFEKAGFANIICEDLNDLLSKDGKKEEQVAEVTVDGKKSFKKGAKLMSDKKVVIKYHSMKTASMPFDADEAEGQDCEDIITQLENSGFTNIQKKSIENSSKEQDTVKSVSVDGKTDYKSYDYFNIGAKIVVTYYTKPKDTDKKKESNSKSSNSESKNDTLSSAVSKLADDTVTPSFKEYMDSYEEFIDKYVELMKNYNSDPMTYMNEYLEYMEKMAEFSEKLDEYDEDSMTPADWLYYTQVVARVNKKLAGV